MRRKCLGGRFGVFREKGREHAEPPPLYALDHTRISPVGEGCVVSTSSSGNSWLKKSAPGRPILRMPSRPRAIAMTGRARKSTAYRKGAIIQ